VKALTKASEPAVAVPGTAVRIKLHRGDRRPLMRLFALADDSPLEIVSHRDLGTLLVAREGAIVVGHVLILKNGRSTARA
jgi:hypothetical protein